MTKKDKIIEVEKKILEKRELLDNLKDEEKELVSQLKTLLGVETGSLTEDTAATFEKRKFDDALEYHKGSLYPKSRMSWDSEKLNELAEKNPEINKARKYSYWSEFKLVPKSKAIS